MERWQARQRTDFRLRWGHERFGWFLEHGQDHPSRWAAISSIAAKIGCTAQSLNEWVKKAEVDSGVRGGVPTELAERLKALEREDRELRQANEILRKASAYFAQAELAIP
jgi:transposase-like protein